MLKLFKQKIFTTVLAKRMAPSNSGLSSCTTNSPNNQHKMGQRCKLPVSVLLTYKAYCMQRCPYTTHHASYEDNVITGTEVIDFPESSCFLCLIFSLADLADHYYTVCVSLCLSVCPSVRLSVCLDGDRNR